VLVKPDGTFKVARVISSTNPHDNAAAIEIANTSTYKPATRNGKRVMAYYDYKISFTGGSAATSEGSAAGGATGLDGLMNLARAGKFAEAKNGATAYLKNNPTDPRANLILGIASSYTNDPLGAASAFDKAGTIPENYRTLAQQTYSEAASAAIKAQQPSDAVGLAKKSIAIGPSVTAFNTLGNAEYALKQYAAATTDLEKARGLLETSKVPAAQRAIIDTNLAAAYFANDQPDRGTAIAKEAAQLDPSLSSGTMIENYYIGKANALRQSGKTAEAGALLEQAAAAVPKDSVALYTSAASDYAAGSTPDFKRAKSTADKALAISPNDARANFVAGIALVNDHDSKNGLVYLNKADAAAKAGSDAALTAQIEAVLKRVPK